MSDLDFTNLIVSYNSRLELPLLLRDLRLYAPSSPTTVIDNASSDGTADLVTADFPEVRLVRNLHNVGYARAVNQGFAMCRSRDVFLLNPDIRLQDAGLFSALSQALLQSPCVAVAGPLQFKDAALRPHLNFTWSYWTPRAFHLYVRYLLGGRPGHVEPLRVTFLNAGCLFVRRSAYESVQGLNEKYFLYGEEPDLFLKLVRFGFQCRLVPDVSVVHAREQSLRSVPSIHRMRFRIAGIRNIADAVLRGVAALIVDWLTGRRPAKSCRE